MKYLTLILLISVVSCKEKNQETDTKAPEEKIEADCNYKLPASATLLYNKSTNEYILRTAEKTECWEVVYYASMQKLMNEKPEDIHGYFWTL
jgi:hypothetical protein